MNRLQSLSGSSLEQFIDGHENENVMKKTNYNVALFLEFLVLKGEIRQIMDKYIDSSRAEQGIRTRNTSLISNFELP